MKRIRLESVDSTNRYAKELAASTEETAFAVTARHQTAGKGRIGRSFESPDGSGIYLSICHKCDFAPEQVGLITAYAAVAVYEAILEQTGLACSIKWVNDLYFGGKKVCGILAEGRIDPQSRSFSHIIIGIGVNVTPPQSGFLAAGKGVAGSLGAFLSTPQPHLLEDLTEAIIRRFERLDEPMASKLFLKTYRERSMLIGKSVTIYRTTMESGDGYPAKVLGIDDEARLMVQTENGEIKTLFSGEVSVRML